MAANAQSISPGGTTLTNLSKKFFAQCCTLLSYFTPGEIGRAQSPISLPLSLKPRKARKKGLPACLVIRFGQSPSEIRPILPAGSSFVAKVLCRSSRLCVRSISFSAISQQLPRGLNPAQTFGSRLTSHNSTNSASTSGMELRYFGNHLCK